MHHHSSKLKSLSSLTLGTRGHKRVGMEQWSLSRTGSREGNEATLGLNRQPLMETSFWRQAANNLKTYQNHHTDTITKSSLYPSGISLRRKTSGFKRLRECGEPSPAQATTIQLFRIKDHVVHLVLPLWETSISWATQSLLFIVSQGLGFPHGVPILGLALHSLNLSQLDNIP